LVIAMLLFLEPVLLSHLTTCYDDFKAAYSQPLFLHP
jgi:hypothetical protein